MYEPEIPADAETIPAGPPVDDRLVFGLGSSLNALGAIKEFLEGLARSNAVDISDDIGKQLHAFMTEVRGFMKRESERGERVEALVIDVKSAMKNLAENVVTEAQKVVRLEQWRVKHERGNEHCSTCPHHQEPESAVDTTQGTG